MLLLVWDKSIGNGYYFQAKVITVSFLLRVMWNDVLYFYLAIQILCWNGLDIIRSVCLRFKKNEMTPEGLQTSFRSYFMRSDFSNSAFIFRQSISFNEIRVTWLSTYSPIWSDTPWCSTSRHVFLSSVVEASKKETLKDVQQIWEMNNLKVFTF